MLGDDDDLMALLTGPQTAAELGLSLDGPSLKQENDMGVDRAENNVWHAEGMCDIFLGATAGKQAPEEDALCSHW